MIVESAGDVNGDGLVNLGDVNAFVLLIAYPAAATEVQRLAADVNRDGAVTLQDINPFVALLAK